MRPLGLQLLLFYFYEREFTNDARFHFCDCLPAGDCMAHFKLLIGASLLAAAFSSHAGYAQVSPPAGYTSPVAGASAYVKTGSSAANSWSWANAAARANGSFNLGGRVITVPAYMRFASNASRLVAAAVVMSPQLRVAAAAAGFLMLAKVFWDEESQTWKQSRQKELPAVQFTIDGHTMFGDSFSACADWATRQNMYKNIPGFSFYVVRNSDNDIQCVSDLIGGIWAYVSRIDGKALTYVDDPITADEAINELAKHPVPQEVPSILPPGVIIPLDSPPIINPSSDPVPVSQPLRVPLGEPVPIPDTVPQQWKTPVVDIVPAPLMPDQPWRVDVQPKDIVKYDPTPISDPQVVNQEPAGQTQQQKTPGLCEQFPDILACQKPNFDTPDIDQIQTRDAAITITPDSGWGADNAVCPAPRHLSVVNANFEFDLLCQFMSGIRPVIIAIAWLSAAMILIGFKRGE